MFDDLNKVYCQEILLNDANMKAAMPSFEVNVLD